MKIDLEKLSNLERRLNVEVPIETVMKAFEKIYKNLQEQVTIKGFRKGKAPLDAIKKMYKDKVSQDVVQDLVSEAYGKAVEDHSLHPVNFPNIQISKFSETEPFQFTAEFEVRPDISLTKYEGLEVKKEKLEITDTQVDSILENIRQSKAEFIPLIELRSAQMGDFAVVDFEGFVDGQPLENAKGNEMTIELGAKQMIPGFEEGIQGMNPGEHRKLNLAFPTEYHVPELAGKPVAFDLTLKAIQKKSLPAINDQLAQDVGGFKTVAELKDAIRADLSSSEERRINSALKDVVLKELVAHNPVDVPKIMVSDQKARLVQDVEERLKRQNLTQEDIESYKTKWSQDFEQSAVFMIQSGFLIHAVAAKQKIEVADRDIDEKVVEFAKSSGIDIETCKKYYDKPEHRSRLKLQILEDQVVDFLVSKAKIKEVSKEDLK